MDARHRMLNTALNQSRRRGALMAIRTIEEQEQEAQRIASMSVTEKIDALQDEIAAGSRFLQRDEVLETIRRYFPVEPTPEDDYRLTAAGSYIDARGREATYLRVVSPNDEVVSVQIGCHQDVADRLLDEWPAGIHTRGQAIDQFMREVTRALGKHGITRMLSTSGIEIRGD